MGYYPDIPVSINGWDLKDVQHHTPMGGDYYTVTYTRMDKQNGNVSLEVTLKAGLLGWIAKIIPHAIRPINEPEETKAPELLTEDSHV